MPSQAVRVQARAAAQVEHPAARTQPECLEQPFHGPLDERADASRARIRVTVGLQQLRRQVRVVPEARVV